MVVGASTNFSNVQQVNQMINRIGEIRQSNTDKTLEVIQTVNAKSSQATMEVMNNAMEVKARSTETKGRIIDVMA